MSSPAVPHLHSPAGPRPSIRLDSGSDKTGPPLADHPTIMVVDDELWVRQMVARILKDQGFNVLEASSAEEALGLLQTASEVRLVLADVAMPGMDGVKLADTIRQQHPAQPVMLMSAFAGVITKIGVRGAPLPVLTKPFTAAQLAQKIQEFLKQH